MFMISIRGVAYQYAGVPIRRRAYQYGGVHAKRLRMSMTGVSAVCVCAALKVLKCFL